MWDFSVKEISLAMAHPDLPGAPKLALPEGYAMRFYQGREDEAHWARIETSAEEFNKETDALERFEGYYGAWRAELPGRMMFLTDASGMPVGTVTGWSQQFPSVWEIEKPPVNAPTDGRLHWVAIDAAHQGLGLSKPMVAAAMARMVELGHKTGYLTTQTCSWVAIKVYLALGWVSTMRGKPDEEEGWEIVRGKVRE